MYLIPIFMHPGSIMLVMVRFMSSANIVHSCLGVILIVYFWDTLGNNILDMAVNIVSVFFPNVGVLVSLANKTTAYTSHVVFDVGTTVRLMIIIVSSVMFMISSYVLQKKIELAGMQCRLLYNMGILIPILSMLGLYMIEDSNISARLISSGFSGFYFSFVYLYLVKAYQNCTEKIKKLDYVYWSFSFCWLLVHVVKINYDLLYFAFPW